MSRKENSPIVRVYPRVLLLFVSGEPEIHPTIDQNSASGSKNAGLFRRVAEFTRKEGSTRRKTTITEM